MSIPCGRIGHLAAADERDVPRLVQHGLAHREQHHHHADAEREAEEEEEGASLPDPEVSKREREEHQSQIAPSSMWTTRSASRREPVVVGDDDERGAVVVEAAEEIEDLAPGRGVELTGGLVGEQKHGMVGERAGDGDPLHLSAGELRGAVAAACRRARRTPAARPRGRARSAGGTPASAIGSSTFSRAVSTGRRWKRWKMKPSRGEAEARELAIGERGQAGYPSARRCPTRACRCRR